MRNISKKPVLIIHTGGTIGMKKTESGYKPLPSFLESALRDIKDLYRAGFPRWELYEMSPLLDSSNMSVREWNSIASVIYEKYSDYSGFVVLHGTDTMAYTASALSFMLSCIDKPIILTGSQIPLSEIRSDGRDNLITSVMIAAEGIVREVALYFGGRLLRGNRAMKMSTDGLLAFDSPSYPHLAEAGISIKYNYDALLSRESSDGQLKLSLFNSVPIGVLKIFPGIQFGLFEQIMTEKLSGIVLETFGAGNIPMGDGELFSIIKKAFSSGAIVAVCSQCPTGAVKLGEYETSSELLRAGAVSGTDMTTEAAVAKLYYLFSLGYDVEKIKSEMVRNVSGELTEALLC
jgi:L-asparaginase